MVGAMEDTFFMADCGMHDWIHEGIEHGDDQVKGFASLQLVRMARKRQASSANRHVQLAVMETVVSVLQDIAR